ncbi:MAG: triose-phosphate isomerase [Hyphomonadaceae bacterium]
MANPKKLIAGNWKMNGLRAALDQVRAVIADLPSIDNDVEMAVCPPATLAAPIADLAADTRLAVGGQDCHAKASGAHTGDISAEMWADLGARYVIVGHSERRQDHGETDEIVASKATAAHRAGLTPIICVGESLEQRKAGKTVQVVTSQVRASLPQSAAGSPFVIAYEPIWAIGTGLTPTVEQVGEVHAAIRACLTNALGPAGKAPLILYGGSVKPDNAAELMHIEEVGGALVGGASLKATDFLAIARAATGD